MKEDKLTTESLNIPEQTLNFMKKYRMNLMLQQIEPTFQRRTSVVSWDDQLYYAHRICQHQWVLSARTFMCGATTHVDPAGEPDQQSPWVMRGVVSNKAWFTIAAVPQLSYCCAGDTRFVSSLRHACCLWALGMTVATPKNSIPLKKTCSSRIKQCDSIKHLVYTRMQITMWWLLHYLTL